VGFGGHAEVEISRKTQRREMEGRGGKERRF